MMLEDLYKRSLQDEVFLLSKMEIENERPYFLNSFVGVNEVFFLNALFVENKIVEAKRFLYKISTVNVYFHEVYKGNVFELFRNFSYPLLSDSRKIIDRYCTYNPIEKTGSLPENFALAVQAILRDDKTNLPDYIKGMDRRSKSKSGWGKNFASFVKIFDGFLLEDSKAIAQAIEEFLLLHDKTDDNRIRRQYINIEATALAKLAHIKGLPVKINNTLVPMALLPVEPIGNYKTYSFIEAVINNI
jgi:hypothetical protein